MKERQANVNETRYIYTFVRDVLKTLIFLRPGSFDSWLRWWAATVGLDFVYLQTFGVQDAVAPIQPMYIGIR